MKIPEQQKLWARLKAANLVAGDLPATATASLWFVRVMQDVGGWIAALFLLGFVGIGLSFIIQSPGTAFFVGAIACAVAGGLLRSNSDNDFTAQFGMALSLAGQGLVLFSLSVGFHAKTSMVALCMGLFQAILFVAIPNYPHRVLMAWAVGCAATFALMDGHLLACAPGLLSVACAWAWLNEFRYAQYATMLRAAGYGLTLAVMTAMVMVTSQDHSGILHTGYQPSGSEFPVWTGAGVSGLALLWAVYQLLLRENVKPVSGAGMRLLAATGILSLATLKAPGLAPATLILLLGFSNGNRVLFGLGVTSLLGYLSFYYYSLDITLLQKSELMATAGIVLLVARHLLLRWWPTSSQQEEHHA